MEVAPRSSTGEIHLIVGPMFAGKTTALLRRIQYESSNGRFGTFYNFVFCVAWLNFELEFMWVVDKMLLSLVGSNVSVPKTRSLGPILNWVI